jgi:calcium-dependent protein kinase
MLVKTASNRATASEALNDPWIRSFHRGTKDATNGNGNGSRSRSSSPTTVKPLCASALTQLKNFHCERKLQQAVMAYIANSMNTKQNEDKLLTIFKQFDSDHDGILTLDEIREGFKEFLGEQMLFEGELNKIMQQIDLNRNGQIEYSEFVAAASNFYQLMTEKHLKQAFDLFDMDANGQITPRELKHILGNKNKEIPDEDWEKLVEEFDSNGDGMINFEEFKRMMLQLHNQ